MTWLKRPRRRDLAAEHLDTLGEGEYQQRFAGYATKANGYPYEGVTGNITVEQWGTPGAPNLIARFTPSNTNGGMASRSKYGANWRPWQDAMGKAL